LRQWLARWASLGAGSGSLAALAEALGGSVDGDAVNLSDKSAFTALLDGVPGEPVKPAACAWLAWLMAQQGMANAVAEGEGWRIRLLTEAAVPAADWMAAAMEQLGGAPA
jgi:hypothetical protein